MKKEINTLLAMESGTLWINKITYLSRLKKDGGGNVCDILRVTFDSPTGRKGFLTKDIVARTPAEIMEEVATATTEFSEKWAAETVKELKAGKIFGDLVCHATEGAGI